MLNNPTESEVEQPDAQTEALRRTMRQINALRLPEEVFRVSLVHLLTFEAQVAKATVAFKHLVP